MVTWWAIVFSDGQTGYMKMQDGTCLGVYYANGVLISPEDKVEYTCVDTNTTAPAWA